MSSDTLEVRGILERYPPDESSLVMVLQDIAARFGYLPCEALEQAARALGVPRARVFSVATFYRAFSLEPQGRVVIEVCKGTACHVRGAQLLEDELCRSLGIPVGGTTEDMGITLRTVNCVGACAMAPVIVVGDTYHGQARPGQVGRIVVRAREAHGPAPLAAGAETAPPEAQRFASPAALLARSAALAARRDGLRARVNVCGGPGCLAAGAREIVAALRAEAAAQKLALEVDLGRCSHGDNLLTLTGCQGLCQQGPLVHIAPDDLLCVRVRPADAAEIVAALAQGRAVPRLLGESRGRGDHPFYAGQELRALEHCGSVDPESLDDYLASGGFTALARTLAELNPSEVVARVQSSGLRGRGGAGFATGRKWRTALEAAETAGAPPYVLCNGDEGDPGAFMDRAIMEGAPFQVLEGMILGAFALRAREGYVYVRNEYPLAVQRLERALAVCRAAGLLGERILGTALSFDVRISRGGGAFVCGESTALMRSIEGKVGEPRAKYVRSVERGLYDRPTVLNNVETWALVPGIVGRGPEWLAALGTKSSKGTKAFSLVGQVRRTGLVEVPMGTTLRQLIHEIGGGVPEGHAFKAVQTGGPSGGCLPDSELDRPIDFEALTEAGSMMGSGGMIVMDDRTCMVDVARYFVDFLQEESCGKCAPCRLGLPQLSALLREVAAGRADGTVLATIEDVCAGMAESSLCGLGKSAPNPVLSTLRWFRDEYHAHLAGRCPAGVCKALVRYEITEACGGCMACVAGCPVDAIAGEKKKVHRIDAALCTKCGVCRSVCPEDAIVVLSGGAA